MAVKIVKRRCSFQVEIGAGSMKYLVHKCIFEFLSSTRVAFSYCLLNESVILAALVKGSPNHWPYSIDIFTETFGCFGRHDHVPVLGLILY